MIIDLPPVIQVVKTESEEVKVVAAWLAGQFSAGILPQERGLFVRSEAQMARARDQLLVTGVEPASEFLDDFMQGIKRP